MSFPHFKQQSEGFPQQNPKLSTIYVHAAETEATYIVEPQQGNHYLCSYLP